MNFEQWLAANSYDAAALNGPEPHMVKQRKHLETAWKAETQPAPEPAKAKVGEDGGYEQEVAAIRKESARTNRLRDITKKAMEAAVGNTAKIDTFEQMCKTAIEEKWDVQRFELSMLRAESTLAPLVLTPKQPVITDDVLTAAICQNGSLKDIDKQFSSQTLEAAHKNFRSGIGLLELVGICAAQNGFNGSAKRNMREALTAAFGQRGYGYDMMAVQQSTINISGILSNVANKFVREQWLFGEQTWSKVTARRAVSDFKQISTYSLTGDLSYEEVPAGGQIQHGTLGEQSYTNQATTYGKLLGLDRRDLINDDIGALAQVSRRLGRGGILKLNDVFWTEFMADASTFYTAAQGNYDDGASDTAMDATGLANANKLFMLLNDPDGKPTGTMPRILLVPPGQWPAAWRLTEGRPPGDTTATISPFAGMFQLEMSRYLANSAYTGYSPLAWYLLADPNDVPVIETVFLNGQEMPTIETAELDFDRLGMAFRGYHDFGVNKQEYRGGVKMKGEN